MSGPAAAFSGLVFALHPLQTESVTYIVGRSGSMAAMFCLAGFLAYIRLSGRPRAAAVISLFCLAVMTKENAVVFPLLLLLYETTSGSRAGRYRLAASTLGMSAIFTMFRLNIVRMNPSTVRSGGTVSHWMTEVFVIPQYLRKVIFPFSLNSDYDITAVTSAADPRFYLSAALLLVIVYGLFRLYSSDRLAGFLGAWFFITILPETAVPLQDYMADHRTYLPIAGFSIIAGYFGMRLLEGFGPKVKYGRAVPAACAGLALVLLGTAACARNAVYSSELAYWGDATLKSPGKSRTASALGLAEYEAGLVDEAEGHFRAAAVIDPRDAKAAFNLASLLAETGRPEQALDYNQLACAVAPGYPKFIEGLAKTYARLGRLDEADETFRKAIAAQPDLAGTYTSYGKFLLVTGSPVKAKAPLLRAVELAPADSYAHGELADAFYLSGDSVSGDREYGLYQRLLPSGEKPVPHRGAAR